MTALFRGGELEAFIPSGGGATESTSGTRYNSAFARCSIALSGNTSTPDAVYADTASWTAQTGDVYFHFEEQDTTLGVPTNNVMSLLSGSTENIRIRQVYVTVGTRTWQVQYLNAGAVWTGVGSAVTLTTDRADYDLYVNVTTGAITLYIRGSESLSTATGLSLGHMSGITKGRLYSDAVGRHFSQVIADTTPTIGRRLKSCPPTGVGANTAWTGSYTEVDEVVLDDADFINSGTATQVETYAVTSPTLTGYVVRDVTVSTRAKRGAAGPQKMRHVLRSAGADWPSGSDITLAVGYAPQQTTWETDPATSAAWVNTAAASLQPGAKSIA